MIKHYTKEIIKLTNIIAIGIFIISVIILTKFKVVYTVYVDNEEIGCIKDKEFFEELVKENLYNNDEDNIAFSEIDKQVKYTSKLVEKDMNITEENILSVLKERADITYFEYAVNVNGKERKYLKTEEEAQEVFDDLIQKLEENSKISISKVYTKDLQVEEEKDISVISNEVIEQLKEEARRETSTINGIYIAVTPIDGYISSRYGSRESIRDHTHQGLDIAALTGTNIKAAADGVISFSGERGGYGNLIIIDHGNGIQTYYGHCNKLYAKVGEEVKAGDVIGEVGSTGNSTGPHLHFEIRQDGKYINPQKYLYK